MSEWLRLLKIFLRIDPLVGMYIVNGSSLGIILGRIETGAEPKYLIHYFCGSAPGQERPFEHSDVETLPAPHMYRWAFFYNRKEAERWRDWRDQLPRRKEQQWEPPQPELPN
jgi:hypothetical protein